MSPKIVDKESKKRQIALIALDVFAEKGFDGASVKDIAEKAKIAKGSIYDYFRSKNDLILYSLSTWINMIGEEGYKKLGAVKDPARRLSFILQGWVDEFLRDKRMIKLSNAIFQLIMSDRLTIKQKKNFYRSTVDPQKEMLIEIFKEGVEMGIFKKSILKFYFILTNNNPIFYIIWISTSTSFD